GIRDATVTGVQTCALPICAEVAAEAMLNRGERTVVEPVPARVTRDHLADVLALAGIFQSEHTALIGIRGARACLSTAGARDVNRSEERRVGREWRHGWCT